MAKRRGAEGRERRQARNSKLGVRGPKSDVRSGSRNSRWLLTGGWSGKLGLMGRMGVMGEGETRSSKFEGRRKSKESKCAGLTPFQAPGQRRCAGLKTEVRRPGRVNQWRIGERWGKGFDGGTHSRGATGMR